MGALRCLAVSSAKTISSFPSQVMVAKRPALRAKGCPSVLRVTCESAESTMSRSAQSARKEPLEFAWQNGARSPYLQSERDCADSSILFPDETSAPNGTVLVQEDYALRLSDKELWGEGTVSEFMTPSPICLQRHTPLRSATQVFLRLGISGAPVVEPYADGEDNVGLGKLVGVLSQRDIVWKEMKPYPSEEDKIHRMPCFYDNLNQGPLVDTLRHQITKIMSTKVTAAAAAVFETSQSCCTKVGGSMTEDAVFVEAGALIADAAAMLLNHNIARLPVVAPLPDGRMTVVGVITASDVLRHAHQTL